MATSCLSALVLDQLNHYLNSTEFLNEARTEPRYFTRQRCLSLVDCILFLLSKVNRSLQIGLNDFLKDRTVCSKQAFSKKRRHIRFEAIRKLAELVRDLFYKHADVNTWMGYRLLGVDGSKVNLTDSPKLMSRFGAQPSSGNQIQCILSAVYDVLNQVILNIRTERWNGNERSLIDEQIREETCFHPGQDIFILDRGYPSAQLIEAFQELGHLFVMRASVEFLNKFKLTSDDCIVEHSFNRNAYTTKLRVVSIQLNDETTEYLVTNLFDPAIHTTDFAQVYHYRWNVEQCFQLLKSTYEVENISGLDEQTFLQDLFAHLTLLNINGVIHFEADIKLRKQNRQRQYPCKLNLRVLSMTLHDRIRDLLSIKSFHVLKKKIKSFIKVILRSVTDIRPDRSYPRVKQHKSQRFPTNQRH